MSGFLSDGARDAIAIGGLLLAIAQIIMALFLGGTKPREQQQSDQVAKQSSRERSFLRNIWKRANNIGLPEEFKTVLAVFVGGTPIVFSAALLSPTLDSETVSVFGVILYMIGTLLPIIQGALLIYFAVVIQEILSKKSEKMKMFFDSPSGIVFFGMLSFVLLLLFLRGIGYLDHMKSSWLQTVLFFYSFGAGVWAIMGLFATTAAGVGALIEKRSKS
jgi:hypothetical protein